MAEEKKALGFLFHTIRESIGSHQKIRIFYKHPVQGMLLLHVHSYDAYGRENTDYLMAYCEEQ